VVTLLELLVTDPLSSLSEPGLNLFRAVPLGEEEEGSKKKERPTKPVIPPEIKNAQLRADIRAMGHMLGQVIQQYQGRGKNISKC
jgi:hypothetical protein